MNQANYLSTKALAKRWSMSHRTLRQWRWRDTGPDYIKFGDGRVRYALEAIKAFEADHDFADRIIESSSPREVRS